MQDGNADLGAQRPRQADSLAETEGKRPGVWDDRMLRVTLGISVLLNLIFAFTIHSLKSPSAARTAEALTGRIARPVDVQDLQGNAMTLSFADSTKPTVIYYFRPECHWCARNLANINALAHDRRGEFRFIGLSPNGPSLGQYVSTGKLAFPVYSVGSAGPIDAIAVVGATPQTVVISKGGIIVKNWIGAFSDPKLEEVEEYFHMKLPGLLPAGRPET